MNVLICTYGTEGIARVAAMQLPRVDGVSYIVSWQCPGDAAVPAALDRPDVRVAVCDTTGLSNNRNNALALADDEVCLIADDDLTYTGQNLHDVMRVMDSHPDTDIATFMMHGDEAKTYPTAECDLRHPPHGYYVSSVEMAVRRRPGRPLPLFDTRFGLGSGLFGVGEEEIFLHRALKAGLVCRFFPIFACTHRGLSTTHRPDADSSVTMAYGACIAIRQPLTAPLRIPLKAWRLRRAGHPFFRSLALMTRGALLTLRHRRH